MHRRFYRPPRTCCAACTICVRKPSIDQSQTSDSTRRASFLSFISAEYTCCLHPSAASLLDDGFNQTHNYGPFYAAALPFLSGLQFWAVDEWVRPSALITHVWSPSPILVVDGISTVDDRPSLLYARLQHILIASSYCIMTTSIPRLKSERVCVLFS